MLTHRPTIYAEWAVCGLMNDGLTYAEPPTCLFCFVGMWDEKEIVRILTRNSVKDIIQEIDASGLKGLSEWGIFKTSEDPK